MAFDIQALFALGVVFASVAGVLWAFGVFDGGDTEDVSR